MPFGRCLSEILFFSVLSGEIISYYYLLADIFVIQPIKIWLVWIVVPSFGGLNEDVFKLCQGLKNRFITLMNRKVGCMRDSHAVLQHLNPACRVARLFPQLPVSRLLMSLNDYDVPRFRVGRNFEMEAKDVLLLGMRDAYRPPTSANSIDPREYFLQKALQLLVATVVLTKEASLFLFTSLPSPLQDTLLELLGILAINLLALSFYLLGRVVLGLAVVLALLLLIAVYLRETTAWRKTELYRIVRDSAPYLVKDLTVFKQKKKFEEMNSDFDSRVLFKSSFSLLDSEITKVDSIYEKRKNKYSLKAKTTKLQVVQPASPSTEIVATEDQRSAPPLTLKPVVAPSKDVQRNISLYAQSTNGALKEDSKPFLFADEGSSMTKGPKGAILPLEGLGSSSKSGSIRRMEDITVASEVIDKKSPNAGRYKDKEDTDRSRDHDDRRRRSKEHKRGSSRSRGRDSGRDKDSESADGDGDESESGRRRAAMRSKKRLNRLSQEIAALQLQVASELRVEEEDGDSDGGQSLASMSARSRQLDGQAQTASQGPYELRHKHKQQKSQRRAAAESKSKALALGPGEGGGSQQLLQQQLQLELQQRGLNHSAGTLGTVQGQGQGNWTSTSFGSAAGPGFAATPMRFSNSFDPMAASNQFNTQQGPGQASAGGTTRSQFPSWH